MNDGLEINGCWLGDDTKSMACPHCGRTLEVDLDDFLPVHSKKCVIYFPPRPDAKESLDDLCRGSWNTKGTTIKMILWSGEPPWKKLKNDAP